MKRHAVLILILVLALLTGLLLQSCQPGLPAGTDAPATTTAGAEPSGPEQSKHADDFQNELYVRDIRQSPTDLEPGLYCLSALEGDGSFQLVVPGQEQDKLVREGQFSSRAWVEVRANELLRFSGAKLESWDEREQQGCFPTRLSDGFFLIGMDLFPGILTVKVLQPETSESPVCEIYASAHDLSEGPIRRYGFDYSLINIEVEEGEFLLLQHAEAYVPPS